jgi:branched-chain amino acid transport system permease protein
MNLDELRNSVRMGLLAGVITLSVSAVGMVESFDQRDLITNVFTLGQLLLFSAPLVAAFMLTRPSEGEAAKSSSVGSGAVIGLFTAVPLILLILLTLIWPTIRDSLVNVSPELVEILSLGQSEILGSVLLAVLFAVLGAVGSAIHLLPDNIRKPLINAIAWTLGIGMLSEVLLNILRPILGRSIIRLLFGTKGVTPVVAVITFVAAAAFTVWWDAGGRNRYQARREAMSEAQEKQARRGLTIGGVVLLLVLPLILGTYLTEVVDNIGLFILMGLGLNIVVGFAGLLDLGYVAFFAIGAYVMGILTSTGDLGIAGMSFWIALPIAVLVAVLFGMTLGIPVLRMRGDYLAIVTLGFGEIIRVLATSDLLKGYIGGAQGILQIQKPEIFGFTMVQPQHFYYLILASVGLAIFVSSRLRDARLGRQWMALREDEDVAEAMGINLVATKLLAFGIGAGFSGLAGAIFAVRLSSIFPHSFNLLISINVLSLIIVGGIGSLPGVVVGALALVGLPELLREFAEYRLLLYGALLIAMMVRRPEGLWPSTVTRREMHHEPEMSPGD